MTGDVHRLQGRNPGREGGPRGFHHTEFGIVAIGDDGLPIIDDDTHEFDIAPDSPTVERYSPIDVEAFSVTDTELGH
ncbi:hypothetical protein ACIRRA_39705 [Nocardia sp. NPDC101769]|uniref:hypothetical protein n=1 Tax=Nocardia sp. NPDC101769 TaxID=3364333 RepID=UPI0038053CDD